MSEYFEKHKMMEYVSNLLSHKAFVARNLKDIYSWIEDHADEFCTDSNHSPKNKKENGEIGKTEKIRQIGVFALHLQNSRFFRKKYAPDCLEKNLSLLQKIFHLSKEETEFLSFRTRLECSNRFSRTLSDLVDEHSPADDLSIALSIGKAALNSIICPDNRLFQLGFLEKSYRGRPDPTALMTSFYFQPFKGIDDIKSFLIGKSLSATLLPEDFKHISQKQDAAMILSAALKKREKGINFLFYGCPGTGKTEFAKMLAQQVSASLYSIGEPENTNDDDYDERYEKLLRNRILLKKEKNAVFLIDEADDLLECYKSDKLKINRLLENNPQPTIWILNNTKYMDKAYLRRFTYAIHFKTPDQEALTDIWQKNLEKNHLPATNEISASFAKKYSVPPSFVETAVKSAKLVNGGLEKVGQMLDILQEAYDNGKKAPQKREPEAATAFNPDLLNTDIDLKLLTNRLIGLKKLNFSLCLYGVSGTGKSSYARYLGDALQIPVLKKRCSDLISMYVGQTEENIADAFMEASAKGALLVFDEADSFLQDRESAVRSWEITQVNEMLTQMESNPLPFVCTTNLMDKLDKASLRRFTFKVRYDYMTADQSRLAFEHFFGIKNAPLSHLSSLSPGDFEVVRKKAEILGMLNDKDALVKMLEDEQKNKAPVHHKIGFI
ncbi:MAG: ATP-binding protein [Alphaproteobacteria bacterium]|nr:ATP-binding protein [Alphaproteobacteria bacterium]